MVEFALALPVVLLLVFGIIEFGYLLFSYSSVNTASRDAARYGIAIGDGTVSGQRYYDCAGIVNAGLRVGHFAGMQAGDFAIQYDNGPDKGDGTYVVKYANCPTLAALGGADNIHFGDRIKVTVTHQYTPIAALMGVPIQPFTMRSTSTRTIIKNANVGNGSTSGGGVGSGGGGGGGGTSGICNPLALTHTGQGSNPTVSPDKGADCDLLHHYKAGEALTLSASPNFGWTVGGWSGTNNDSSVSYTNFATMPDAPLTVEVTYVNSNPNCYPLSLGIMAASTGNGAVPTASASGACSSAGEYAEGETITVTAVPEVGSEVGVWSGTTNDSSKSNQNTVVMPAGAHSVEVLYILTLDCYSLTTTHTGNGLDPFASAPNCLGTKYTAGTVVNLTATADAGYEVTSWNGTNNDASKSIANTVTMTGDKTVTVNYEATSVLGPPLSVVVPTGPGEWYWNAGTNECQQIDLRWAVNGAWSPEVPVYYEVFRGGVSYGNISGTHWDANFKTSVGTQITLAVRAVFAGGVTSKTQEVTYACLVNDLVFWGSVVK